jgi:hypothetical protein
MTSSALNLRTGWKYLLENIYCPLDFEGGRFTRSGQPNLTATRKFATALLDTISYTPAFLNKEQDYGAF